MKVALALAVGLLMCVGAAVSAAPADVPYLTGRVVDNAEVLSPGAADRIAALSQSHERETGDQIAVLTVKSLEGRSVEEFAVAVFEAWKLGQKGKDNGVLVVIVPPERRMRIEVGYGLEGQLTDLASSRIIRDVMAPHFKRGDFDRGIEEGVRAIIAQVKGEPAAIAEPQDSAPRESSAKSGLSELQVPDLPIIERILIGAFIFGIIGLFTVLGVLTPGIGWFLYVFLIPFWAMFPIVVVGTHGTLVLLVIYLIGYPLAKVLIARSGWYKQATSDLKKKGRATIGGFVVSGAGGSGSSWSSGSSFGSSGGFSGGGGRSGGGGASGSW